jgi:transketolase
MLLYAELYLTGYPLSMSDLQKFRQLGSRCPGHPELGVTPGVEATTGPLGQGFAMAVGMALAFRRQRMIYDPIPDDGTSPFDRKVWVIASDGDLEEGISYEAGAIAGRQHLGNLTVVYDNNGIQIDGNTKVAWDEDVQSRFSAQGWEVRRVSRAADGDIDTAGLANAIDMERSADRPLLIILDTEIAWPAPLARGTAASHGSPLGPSETLALKRMLGVGSGTFEVPEDVLSFTRRARERGRALHAEWTDLMKGWRSAHPKRAAAWDDALAAVVPKDLDEKLLVSCQTGNRSTRDASGEIIQTLASLLPDLVGGSADLSGPNRTDIKGAGVLLPGEEGALGRNIRWGVREHAMAAALNGMLLAGGVRAFCGTFLVFSDYERPAIRLASLMGLPAIYVWSHDSIAVGEDGPTHQPIEQLASLRAMPGLSVYRPADSREVAAAWSVALEGEGPTGIALCRQSVPTLPVSAEVSFRGAKKGAYIVAAAEDPHLLFLGTGSEVHLCIAAAEALASEGIRCSVVSMPCRERFERQPEDYRNTVLPPRLGRRIIVEAATPFGWEGIAGPHGVVVGVRGFGASGPAKDVQESRGMTVEAVVQAARTCLG